MLRGCREFWVPPVRGAVGLAALGWASPASSQLRDARPGLLPASVSSSVQGVAPPASQVNPRTAGPHQGLAATFSSESHILVPRKLQPEHFQPNPLFINLISILGGNSARKLWIHHHDTSSYGWENQAWRLRNSSQEITPAIASPRASMQKRVPEGRLLPGSRPG